MLTENLPKNIITASYLGIGIRLFTSVSRTIRDTIHVGQDTFEIKLDKCLSTSPDELSINKNN